MTEAERNQKILSAIKRGTARALASKKIARETLIEEGIYTRSGRLRVEFGGPGKRLKDTD
jgi:hypothetical protein